MDVIKEWWHIGATMFAAVVAYIIGQNRNAWQVAQLEKDIADIRQRVQALETQGTVEAVTLGKIETLLKSLHESIAELRNEVKSKADK